MSETEKRRKDEETILEMLDKYEVVESEELLRHLGVEDRGKDVRDELPDAGGKRLWEVDIALSNLIEGKGRSKSKKLVGKVLTTDKKIVYYPLAKEQQLTESGKLLGTTVGVPDLTELLDIDHRLDAFEYVRKQEEKYQSKLDKWNTSRRKK